MNDSTILREDIPLREPKQRKSHDWIFYCLQCRGYYLADCLSGLGLVYTSFFTVSAVLTSILFMQISYGAYQVEPHGNVITDAYDCSSIGTAVIRKGGNAVDAAVAAGVCLAVVNPHTTGLDAAGIAMIYDHRLRHAPQIIDFGNSIAFDTSILPRLIIGLAHLHRDYGKLTWRTVIEPSIQIARTGFLVSKQLATAVEMSNATHLYGSLVPGQRLTLPILGDTLQTISNLTASQLDDFLLIANEPMKKPARNVTFMDYNIYLPSSDTILSDIVDEINSNVGSIDVTANEYILRMAEIIQTCYVKRNITARVYEETASTVVTTDADDLYVILISGLNGMLGSLQLSPAQYIIDYPREFEATGAIPIVITDPLHVCGRRVVFGTSDASIAAQMITQLIVGNQSVHYVVEQPRFRVLSETDVGVEDNHEPSLTSDELKMLQGIGKIFVLSEPYDGVNMIELRGDTALLQADTRSGGSPSHF